jgi:small subunit ribosomal protein S20
MRADKKRRQINLRVASELKTLTKKAETLLAGKKTAEAKKAVNLLMSKLDKAVKKHVIHKNTASRKKSRMLKQLHKISAR